VIEEVPALVIGAGPAGLMAAGMLSAAGHPVVIAESMPSPARKFLMAGKSGLNLTKDEPAGVFAARVQGGAAPASLRDAPPGYFDEEELQAIVRRFGPAEIMDWARGLEVELFTGSTGRVFPVGMKASPLLRVWLARLDRQGVQLRRRWRWTGFAGGLAFKTPEGPRTIRAGVAVLALGGASWPRLGSDAAWVPWLRAAGVGVAPFRPANMGFCVYWSPAMAPLHGMAVKGTRLTAGALGRRGGRGGTKGGVEGGAGY